MNKWNIFYGTKEKTNCPSQRPKDTCWGFMTFENSSTLWANPRSLFCFPLMLFKQQMNPWEFFHQTPFTCYLHSTNYLFSALFSLKTLREEKIMKRNSKEIVRLKREAQTESARRGDSQAEKTKNQNGNRLNNAVSDIWNLLFTERQIRISVDCDSKYHRFLPCWSVHH